MRLLATPNRLVQPAGGLRGVGGFGQSPDDRDPRRAGGPDRVDVRRRDAADREERHGGVLGGVADELEPDRWAAGLGRRGMHRTDPDVVDRKARGGIDLSRAVGGEPDQPARAHDRTSLVDRHVVLADVHAVGAGGRDQVRAVVEDEQRLVLCGCAGKPPGGGDDRNVAGVLHAQLNDVHTRVEYGGQELVGLLVAHQVEVRVAQA